MNRANPLASKADNSKIGRERSVNVSGASVKNKVAVSSRVAVNRAVVSRAAAKGAAVNRADDKAGLLTQTKRREVIPAALCV